MKQEINKKEDKINERKANKALNDLIKRAKLKDAFVSETTISDIKKVINKKQ